MSAHITPGTFLHVSVWRIVITVRTEDVGFTLVPHGPAQQLEIIDRTFQFLQEEIFIYQGRNIITFVLVGIMKLLLVILTYVSGAPNEICPLFKTKRFEQK